MSTITPFYRNVQALLQSQSFAIDEYQREYKWEKEHIEELLSDFQAKFTSCYKPGDETTKISNYEEYFLGSIIVSKRNGQKYLIDGQQRITSLTLLLICLYRKAKEKNLPITQTIAPMIFSDNLGKPMFNLNIQERLPILEALFYGDSFNPDGKDESVQAMFARYADITNNDFIEELDQDLPHFAYWLMTKVGLIEISTDNDDYAYAIFETMNDRGKPLSPVDMLKAYLLAPIEDTDRRFAANKEWKKQVLDLISWKGQFGAERDANCIKAWFRAQYALTTRDRKPQAVDKDWELIGSAFHRWVRDNHKRLNLGTEATNYSLITTDFPFFSRAYQSILEGSKTYTKGLEAVFYNAHNDFTWQTTVLLAPLNSTDDDLTVRNKIAATSTYLDIWLMRRVVNYIRVGYSSTSYAMWGLCRDIRNKSLPELVDILLNKLNQDDVTFAGSPSRGRGGINELGLNQFSRRYIFHLLARITAYTETQSGRTDSFDKYVDRTLKNPFDIEHIIPDNYYLFTDIYSSPQEFSNWRNHIASLLLLPTDVNRSLQAKSFEEKVVHYEKQNIYAASFGGKIYQHQPQFIKFKEINGFPFKTFDKFNKAEQLERRKLVEALVNKIWSPNRISEVLNG